MISHKLPQIYKQYLCSIISLFLGLYETVNIVFFFLVLQTFIDHYIDTFINASYFASLKQKVTSQCFVDTAFKVTYLMFSRQKFLTLTNIVINSILLHLFFTFFTFICNRSFFYHYLLSVKNRNSFFATVAKKKRPGNNRFSNVLRN